MQKIPDHPRFHHTAAAPAHRTELEPPERGDAVAGGGLAL